MSDVSHEARVAVLHEIVRGDVLKKLDEKILIFGQMACILCGGNFLEPSKDIVSNNYNSTNF